MIKLFILIISLTNKMDCYEYLDDLASLNIQSFRKEQLDQPDSNLKNHIGPHEIENKFKSHDW